MKGKKLYRHGEILFVEIVKLPKDLQLSDSKIIVKGQNGHSHCIDNGELYFKDIDTYIFGYLVAKNTSLLHDEHGTEVIGSKSRIAKLPNGVYELRKQQEFINNELKPVID